MKAGSHRPDRNLHHGGDLVVAELLHLPKDKGRAEIRGKLVQEALDDDTVFDCWSLARLRAIELDEFRPFETQTVHAEPNADPVEVTRERTVVPQFPDLAERLEERLLRDVLRFMPVSQKVGGGTDESVAVLVDEEGESRLVAVPYPRDPLSLKRGRIGGSRGEASKIKHWTTG